VTKLFSNLEHQRSIRDTDFCALTMAIFRTQNHMERDQSPISLLSVSKAPMAINENPFHGAPWKITII
ncbi:unnamed protein product, partial [Acidithrix sp. C25]